MESIAYINLGLLLVIIVSVFLFRPKKKSDDTAEIFLKFDEVNSAIQNFETHLKEDFKTNREETSSTAKVNRDELTSSIKDFRQEVFNSQKEIAEQNHTAFSQINSALDLKIEKFINKQDENEKYNRDTLVKSLKEFTDEVKTKFDEIKAEQKNLTDKTVEQLEKVNNKVEERLKALTEQDKIDNTQMREALIKAFKDFQEAFDNNVKSFNDLQREKFDKLEIRQNELVKSTETKLETIRITVEEKLEKTLSERLGQSFETVGKQLIEVQKGLGEMQTLAQDVGGLKKVLSNVKMRGGIGEVQLAMLLEQLLAPDQYEANVKTKSNSNDLVEFAIKLPGRDENNSQVWLPIDAKFPKDIYEQLQTAYEIGDLPQIDTAQKLLEATIKKMAKDISDKYIDPPNTTDFGIMFLPFEGIYAEVVRKASLLEDLQRNYKIIVTGPTTLAAILNSLQMGFKTLAIQKRSGEVWQVLGAVKKEFENFGGMLDKAHKNIHTGLGQLDDVMGKRTRAIQRSLRNVETLSESEAKKILPEISEDVFIDDEN